MRLDREMLLRTTALVAFAMPAHAQLAPNARPTGGAVSAGQATITAGPTTTTINQQSQRAALNWQSFNVGSAQTVQFNQPGASAIALNRVLGGDPSQIGGRILANGQVVLINQSGVIFTKGSQVDTAGLVVSAAGMSDSNFMAGRMVFDQAAHAGAVVSNAGNITIRQAGLAALVAPQVANSGVITATLGRVVLGGAVTHTLDLYGDGLVALNVTGQVTQASLGGKKVTALVTNSGTILAPGGSVVLTAAAVDGVVSTLVTAGGTIGAATAGGHTGRVLVQGIGGGVEVDGDVSATGSGAGATGGQVAVNATGAVTVAQGATIDASGTAGGGAIALGTTMARAVHGPAAGSSMTAGSVTVARGATVRADATGKGKGGRIALLSRHATAQSGTLSAQGGPQGGDGGWIEVSSEGQLDFAGQQLTGAPAGHGGTLYIDPADLIIGTSGGGTATALITPAQFNAFTGDVIIKADGTVSVTANATLNPAATSLELSGNAGVFIGATLDAHGVPVTLISTGGDISDLVGNTQGIILASSLQAFTRGGNVLLTNPQDSYATIGAITVTGDNAQGEVATLDNAGNVVTRAPGTQDSYSRIGISSLDGSVELNDSIPLQVLNPVDASGEVTIDDGAATGTTVLAANITANSIDITAAAINQSMGLISIGNGGGQISINSNAAAGGGITLGGTITAPVDSDGFGGTVSLFALSGSIIETGTPGALGLINAGGLEVTASGAGGSVALDNPANEITTLLTSQATTSFSLANDESGSQGGLFVQGTIDGGQTLSLTSSGITLAQFNATLEATQRIILQADSFDLSAPVSAPDGAVFIDRLTPGTLVLGGTNDSFGTAALGNITSTILALGTTNGVSPGVATGVDIETSLSSTATGSAFLAFAHAGDGTGDGSITINAPVTYGTIGLEGDHFAIAAAVTASNGGLVGIALADPGTLTAGGATSVVNQAALEQITAGTLSLGSLDAVTPGAAVLAVSIDGQIPFAGETVGVFAQGDILETAPGQIFAGTIIGASVAGSIALGTQNQIPTIGNLTASTGITITVSGEQPDGPTVGLAIEGDVVTQAGTIAITSAEGPVDLIGLLQAGTLGAGGYTGAVALLAQGGDITETGLGGGGGGTILAGALSAQAPNGAISLENADNFITSIAPVAGLSGLSASGDITLVDGSGLAILAPVTGADIALTAITGDLAIGNIVQAGTATGGIYSGTATLLADAGDITETVPGQAGFGTIRAGTLAAEADGKGGPFDITLDNPAGNAVAVIGPIGDFTGLDASGDIAFIGGQALSVTGLILSGAGSIALETTAGDLAIGGALQSGNLAGGTYDGTVTLLAESGNITETTPGAASATGTILTGILAAQAGIGTAAFDITLDDMANNQVASIAAAGGLAGLSATGSVLFEGAEALSIPGTVQSGTGAIQIITRTGDIALGGTLRAGTNGTGTASIVADGGNITETLPGGGAPTGTIEAGSFAAQAGTPNGIQTILLNAAGNEIGTIAAVGNLIGLSAGGAITLTDAQALLVAGTAASTAGPVTLTVGTGDLAIAGTVQSGTLGGGAYGGTAILLAQAGNITETATGQILAGTLAAQATNITLDSTGNNIAVTGPAGDLAGITASGDIVLDDGRSLTITGQMLAAGGSVTIATATGGIVIGGTIQSGATVNGTYTGSLTLQAAAGISETLADGSGPSGTILTGDLAATANSGGIALDNSTNEIATIATANGVTASGDIAIIDAQALNIAGSIVGGNVALTLVSGDLTLGGTLQAGALVRGNYSGTANLVTQAGNITSTAGTLLAGVLTGSTSGSLTASTPASASAGNQVASIGAFDADGAFIFADGQALAITGALRAGAPISLTAPSLQIVKSGSITEVTGGLISLVADNFLFDGPVSAPTGIVAIDLLHDGSLVIGPDGTLPSLASISAGTIALGSLDGLTQSPGNTGQLWTAGSAGSITDLVIAAPLDLTGNAAALGLFSNGSIASDEGITAGTLYGAAGGTLAASGSAIITGPNSISTLGSFTVGTAAAGDATAFELTDDIALTVTAPIVAASGTAGRASGGVTIAVTGGATLDLGMDITGSDVLLSAGGGITQTGQITALGHTDGTGGTIELASAGGGIAQDGILTAATVLLSAAGDISQASAASIQAGILAANAGGAIELGSATNQVAEISPSQATGLGGLTAGGDIDFADAESLTLAGATISGANISFALPAGAVLTQTGGRITATGNAFFASGVAQTGGAITADGSIAVSGTLTQTSASLTAGGDVLIGLPIGGGSQPGNPETVQLDAPLVPITDGLSQTASTIDAGGSVQLQTSGGFVQTQNSRITGATVGAAGGRRRPADRQQHRQHRRPRPRHRRKSAAPVEHASKHRRTHHRHGRRPDGKRRDDHGTRHHQHEGFEPGSDVQHHHQRQRHLPGRRRRRPHRQRQHYRRQHRHHRALRLHRGPAEWRQHRQHRRRQPPAHPHRRGADDLHRRHARRPNIVIGATTAPARVNWNNATIETGSSLEASGIKGALSGPGLADTDPGIFVTTGNFTQTGTTSVTPLGGQFATIQITLTQDGSIDFGPAASEVTATAGGLQAPDAQLILLLGTGTATGNIDVADLGVSFTPGGSATLTGSVSGLTQFAAAGAGVAFPSPNQSYTLNGCEIGGPDCGIPPPLPFQLVPVYDPVAEVSDTDLLAAALAAATAQPGEFIVLDPEEEAFVGTVRKRRESDDVILPDVGTVDY